MALRKLERRNYGGKLPVSLNMKISILLKKGWFSYVRVSLRRITHLHGSAHLTIPLKHLCSKKLFSEPLLMTYSILTFHEGFHELILFSGKSWPLCFNCVKSYFEILVYVCYILSVFKLFENKQASKARPGLYDKRPSIQDFSWVAKWFGSYYLSKLANFRNISKLQIIIAFTLKTKISFSVTR